MSEIANSSIFPVSKPRRQQQLMASIMYLFIYFLTLFTPFSSSTPTKSIFPTCYEPTSGYAKPLSGIACIKVANAITAKYADITWDLTHGPPIFFDWIQCPLTMEQDGCYFRMDYWRPPKLRNVALECPRHIMISALLFINSECVTKNNVDGGELVLKLSDGSSITFSLTHPPTTLSGGNGSSADAADVDSNLLLTPVKQGSTGSS